MLGLLGNIDDNFLNIRNRATEIKDKIMEWLGFQKTIDLLTGETKWKYLGFDTTLKNIWKWWKNLNAVAKIFIGLGVYIVLSKIITFAIKAAKAILGIGTAFASLNLALVGIVGIGTGLFMFIAALQDIIENGFSVKNSLELIGGAIIVVASSIAIMKAVLGDVSGLAMLTVGAATTAALSVVGLTTVLSEQQAGVNDTVRAIVDYNATLEEMKQKETESMEVTYGKIERANELIDSLEGLIDANGRIVGSEDEVGSKLYEINNLLGTEYEITNGQVTLNGKLIGTYDDLKASVDNYCKQLRVKSELELLEERHLETLKQKKNLQEQQKKLLNEITEDTKNYDMTSSDGYLQWIRNNSNKIVQMKDLKDQIDDNEESLKQMEEAGYLYSQGRFDEAAAKLDETIQHHSGDINNFITETTAKVKGIPDEFKNVWSDIQHGQYSKITLNVDADVSKANSAIASINRTLKLNIPSITPKAEGGFLTQGEVFVAREAGPELVGTMNGHSAVANNDQIIKGIQGGVFNGMMSALSNANLGGGNVTIEASGDTEGLLNFISFKQKQKNRQFN